MDVTHTPVPSTTSTTEVEPTMTDAKSILQGLTKTCSNPACLGFTTPLLLDQFYVTRTNKSGYTSRCKSCCNQQSAAYYRAHTARLREQHSARYPAIREQVCQQKVAYRQANREQIRQQRAAFRQANREILSQRRVAHRNAHPELYAAYYRAHAVQNRQRSAAYQRAHPEWAHSQVAKHRARRLCAPVSDFTEAQWRAMKDFYDHRCAYCGKKPKRLTQDHITPLSKGGSHTLSNIVPACRSCNSSKGTKAPLTPVQPLLLIA
jgi:5-methylcytosine-specific restriction endonuclease McrA